MFRQAEFETKDRLLADLSATCRKIGGSRSRRSLRTALNAFALLIAATTMIAFVATAGAAEWEETGRIARVAEEFVKEHRGSGDARLTAKAGHLDARLQLPGCEVPLEAFLRDGTRIESRTAVGVRCTGTQPWKIYVPVNIVIMDEVYIARRMLPRGHIIKKDDIIAEKRDISRLRAGFITDANKLIGQRLKHHIAVGKVIAPAQLAADVIITRGQTVTLLLNNNGLQVSMSGKALSDGVIDERIRVENQTSRKIVEGFVRSSEHVELITH